MDTSLCVEQIASELLQSSVLSAEKSDLPSFLAVHAEL
jgi:hypothetical protein